VKRLGLRAGAATLFAAARQLASSPRLWRYALVPAAVLSAACVVGLTLLGWFGVPHVFHSVAALDTAVWYERIAGAALALLAWLVGAALVLLSSWVITPVLCAPVLEALVRQVESTLGAAPQPTLSFFTSLWCGVRAQLTGLFVLGPLWLVLWALNLALPALSPLLIPARLLALSLGLAWNLLDYPLTLRGVAIRERWAFMRAHPRAIFGFGLAFAAVFWIPLAPVLLLPLGVIGATRLVWQIAAVDEAWRARLSRQLATSPGTRS
jgi:CysZ protein